jgi:hypothetical protein
MPMGCVDDKFNTDRVCSDRFNTDRFRTQYVSDRYVMSVHLNFMITIKKFYTG